MRMLMYLVFFICGVAAGVSAGDKIWKERLKEAVLEKEMSMQENENTVRREAYDTFLQTLFVTCSADNGGMFSIQVPEVNIEQIFICAKQNNGRVNMVNNEI